MLRHFIACFTVAACFSVQAGEIALTFDDAPTHDSVVMNGMQRTETLIQVLKASGVHDAMFFVLAKNLTEQSSIRLQKYRDAGFELANHSFSHQSANDLDADDFLLDVYQAHLKIKKIYPEMHYFRFPYLHSGDSPAKRAAILNGLYEMGYRVGYVTVDNFDWYINSLYVQAVEQGKTIDLKQLGKLYVDVIWEGIQFYDEMAIEYLGASPKHVLLLHENDIAAMFISQLIEKIRSSGWKIISPKEAYNERMLRVRGDNFNFSKQGRVASIAEALGAEPQNLRSASENAAYIDNLFIKYKVIK